MSDAPKENKEAKEAAPAAEGGAKPAEPAKPSAKPKLVLPFPVVPAAIVAGALVAGVALGSLLLGPQVNRMRHDSTVSAAMHPNAKAEKKKEKKKEGGKEKKGEGGKSPIYKLDNVIVNPAGSMGQRFLMCSVAIESDDTKALDDLREHEIELRDRVISVLAKQSLDRLTAEASRDSLRGELLVVIRHSLPPEDKDAELHVYLPQFVVQ